MEGERKLEARCRNTKRFAGGFHLIHGIKLTTGSSAGIKISLCLIEGIQNRLLINLCTRSILVEEIDKIII